jgi:hypothetical protein
VTFGEKEEDNDEVMYPFAIERSYEEKLNILRI